MDNKTQIGKVSPRDAKAARAELERALSHHFQSNKAAALKSLRSAVAMDRSLANEPLAKNLAHELTGLPVEEALSSLTDGQSGKRMIDTAQRERRQTPVVRRQRVLVGVFVLLCMVFLGLLVWSVFDGTLQRALGGPGRVEQFNLSGYEYFVSVPRGRAPENGWPVVVAFHGYGSNAQQLLPLATDFNEAGAIFIAPTFGTYEPNPGNGPLEPASQILIEVGKQYPLETRGAILFGFSQGGSFAYRFSVYYSNQVAGVVTAGAPELDPILPTRNIPYVFTWGELDELHRFVMPSANAIQSRSLQVRTAIVPGAGHVVTQYALDQALLLVKGP